MSYREEGRRFLIEVAAGWPDTGRGPEREAICGTASTGTSVHVNDRGRCAVCGSVFPCVRTIQAVRARTAR
ncbi:MAG: hypothetical protein ACRDPK_12240 [Carbonactinosporaceae bacterium]